jgi:hypothetical protein
MHITKTWFHYPPYATLSRNPLHPCSCIVYLLIHQIILLLYFASLIDSCAPFQSSPLLSFSFISFSNLSSSHHSFPSQVTSHFSPLSFLLSPFSSLSSSPLLSSFHPLLHSSFLSFLLSYYHLPRFRADSLTNQFWVENLSGCQLDSMPLKSLKCIR